MSITIGSIKRVKGLVEVDLLKLDEGDPPLLTMLGIDVQTLVDVIFALIKPQADAQGVSDEEWAEARGGDAILDAHTAFHEDLADFSRSLGRKDLVAAIEAQKNVIALATEAGRKMIEDKDLDELVERVYGSESTNSPPQPESSPNASP